MSERVLLVGVSTRSAAASAAAAGYRVQAIDAFADLDQHPDVTAHAVRRGFGPRAAARTASRIPSSAVAYLSPFENHPDAIASLAAGRTLWGNGPAVVRAVRDPQALVAAAQRSGVAFPRLGGARDGRWLMKPLASGGGRGIREWRPGRRLLRRHYLQEFLEGTLASIAFVANGREAVLVGLTRQLSGLSAFGAPRYTYCGSIFDPALLDASLLEAARRLASAMTAEFRLVGVNVIDVMIHDGMPYVLEVNPRWSASLELIEAACDLNLFGAHADACATRRLPAVEPAWRRSEQAFGKAIVYARTAACAIDTHVWLRDATIRDVPRSGTHFKPGGPICTVTAKATDADSCLRALETHAARIYLTLRPREVPAA